MRDAVRDFEDGQGDCGVRRLQQLRQFREDFQEEVRDFAYRVPRNLLYYGKGEGKWL